MKRYFILFLSLLNYTFCEWIALPSISVKTNSSKRNIQQAKVANPKNSTVMNEEISCPDIHNLTMMSFMKDSVQQKTQPEVQGQADDIFFQPSIDLPSIFNSIPKSVAGKLAFLKAMEERIMLQVEDRIQTLDTVGHRQARGKELGFPSMEGALISISLLLFGVYLIKLVGKILHSLHAKVAQGDILGALSGIRRPISLNQGRRKRSSDLELARIQLMQILDKQYLQFN